MRGRTLQIGGREGGCLQELCMAQCGCRTLDARGETEGEAVRN